MFRHLVSAVFLIVCCPLGVLVADPTPPAVKLVPTLADVPYGDHPRQVLDFYRADSEKPTPVLIYLHGGAWLSGDKTSVSRRDFSRLLDAGISVVSVNYRYTSQAKEVHIKPPVSWPMADTARALQFVRSKAAEWNIDPLRAVGCGNSAGACSILWLAFHDDLADPASADPVARQSTRLLCVALDAAQTSLDPVQMREWTPNSRYGAHAFGLPIAKDFAKNETLFEDFVRRRDEVLPWIKQYSPIELATPDDPPVYLSYDNPPALGQPQKDPTHSANFGVKLKERLDALGVPCELAYPGAPAHEHDSIESYLIAKLGAAAPRRVSIADHGALADGVTVNTAAIQKTIDSLAASGGGTVVIPAGVFVSGALFLKPGVHLHLDKDAVLRASTDVAANFPARRTRIEGHFEEAFTPALINADHCDGLRITGEGTLDGAGRPIWDLFWKLRAAAPDKKNFKNLSLPRARLALIENSKDVLIEGVAFKDSQFWNLHLYRCRDVLVKNVRISVPDDYKQAPSTDGIDVDSSQDVTIDGCTFSVTDDCVAMKGSKGPFALDDKDSPPVERVRITNCVFKRGHNAVTLGSEATIVRDLVVENGRVTGAMSVLCFKLRPDTPQTYENIRYSGLVLENAGGEFISVKPWTQYFDLKGQTPPQSIVRNITITGITGRYGSFGVIAGNPGQTSIGNITLENIDVQLKDARLKTKDVRDLKFQNVTVNGAPVTKP